MGESQNVRVMYPDGNSIYLYAHVGGIRGLQRIVAEALDSQAGRNRWEDESYCTRIIFDRMIQNLSEPGAELGLGISTYPVEQDYPDITVAWPTHNSTYPVVSGLHPETFIRRTLADRPPVKMVIAVPPSGNRDYTLRRDGRQLWEPVEGQTAEGLAEEARQKGYTEVEVVDV